MDDSVIEPFEHALFYLQDLAFRATPGIRKILEGDTGRYPPFGVTFCRIIDIVAFKANPPA